MSTLVSASITGGVIPLHLSDEGKPNFTVGASLRLVAGAEVLQAFDHTGQASGHILSLWMAGRWLPFSLDSGGCFGQYPPSGVTA